MLDDELDDSTLFANLRSFIPPEVAQPNSILKEHLEKLGQESSTTSTPPPPEMTQPEPPAEASSTASSEEQPKKKVETIYTAKFLRQFTYAMHLETMLKPYLGNDTVRAIINIMGEIYQEYKCPEDPIIRMRIQQIVLYHEIIPVLTRLGLSAPSMDAAKVYFSAAHRMAEDFERATNQLRDILFELSERSSSKEHRDRTVLDLPKKGNRKKTG